MITLQTLNASGETHGTIRAKVNANFNALITDTPKATIVDGDIVRGVDSVTPFWLVSYTFANIKSFLKTYFDAIYFTLGGNLGTPASGNLSNCTVDGTDQVGFKNCPINSQSADYTLTLADMWKTIYHPSADTTPRTFTIPANASVPAPIGSIVTFENDISAGTLTIPITTDTLVLVWSAWTTGSRTLGPWGRAVAQKVTSTRWRIDGNQLT